MKSEYFQKHGAALCTIWLISQQLIAPAFAGDTFSSLVTPQAEVTAGTAIDGPTPAREVLLKAGTAILVAPSGQLSTKANKQGESFGLTVLADVTDGPSLLIPKGVAGSGEITFATNNGSFGKPGILMIAVRYLDLNGKRVPLDGRYRQEGANKDDETAATMFVVGILSGAIKGNPAIIPAGRQLRARLGSGLIDQSQKMTVAARAMAEKKTVGHRS